ncbi:MAG: hypothetical protein NTV15_07065 [Candidatus Bathyarchaeota archaeon]|nr:hypothetical protein [Candidatus Bathyarchaeota archaeon]
MSGDKKKPTLEEILPRLKMFVILVMLFPMVGMVLVVGIIWFQQPKNMDIILTALVLLMIFYAVSIYYLIKKNDAVAKSKLDTVN